MYDTIRYSYSIDTVREEQFHIPEWAKAEHLERIVPEKKLWGIGIGKERKKI